MEILKANFGFALQSSEAPMRFGASVELSYSFDEDNIEDIKVELKAIEHSTPMEKIKKFF